RPSTVFVADSRAKIDRFENVILKGNRSEICGGDQEAGSLVKISLAASRFSLRTERPVFTTCGAAGRLVTSGRETVHIPARIPDGPIDITGAGDTATSALTAALCAKADPVTAGILATVACSLSIEQLGDTGIAKPEQILSRYGLFLDRNRREGEKFALRRFAS